MWLLLLRGFRKQLNPTWRLFQIDAQFLLSLSVLFVLSQVFDSFGPSGSRPRGASSPQKQPERETRVWNRAQRGHPTLRNTLTSTDTLPFNTPFSFSRGSGCIHAVWKRTICASMFQHCSLQPCFECLLLAGGISPSPAVKAFSDEHSGTSLTNKKEDLNQVHQTCLISVGFTDHCLELFNIAHAILGCGSPEKRV